MSNMVCTAAQAPKEFRAVSEQEWPPGWRLLQKHMWGYPKWNILLKWMIWGYPCFLGNLHVCMSTYICTHGRCKLVYIHTLHFTHLYTSFQILPFLRVCASYVSRCSGLVDFPECFRMLGALTRQFVQTSEEGQRNHQINCIEGRASEVCSLNPKRIQLRAAVATLKLAF